MERLIELTKRHKKIMDEKNIIVSVYTNASGFLWGMCMVDSGNWRHFKYGLRTTHEAFKIALNS